MGQPGHGGNDDDYGHGVGGYHGGSGDYGHGVGGNGGGGGGYGDVGYGGSHWILESTIGRSNTSSTPTNIYMTYATMFVGYFRGN
jgi:hypothetical protein